MEYCQLLIYQEQFNHATPVLKSSFITKKTMKSHKLEQKEKRELLAMIANLLIILKHIHCFVSYDFQLKSSPVNTQFTTITGFKCRKRFQLHFCLFCEQQSKRMIAVFCCLRNQFHYFEIFINLSIYKCSFDFVLFLDNFNYFYIYIYLVVLVFLNYINRKKSHCWHQKTVFHNESIYLITHSKFKDMPILYF